MPWEVSGEKTDLSATGKQMPHQRLIPAHMSLDFRGTLYGLSTLNSNLPFWDTRFARHLCAPTQWALLFKHFSCLFQEGVASGKDLNVVPHMLGCEPWASALASTLCTAYS